MKTGLLDVQVVLPFRAKNTRATLGGSTSRREKTEKSAVGAELIVELSPRA